MLVLRYGRSLLNFDWRKLELLGIARRSGLRHRHCGAPSHIISCVPCLTYFILRIIANSFNPPAHHIICSTNSIFLDPSTIRSHLIVFTMADPEKPVRWSHTRTASDTLILPSPRGLLQSQLRAPLQSRQPQHVLSISTTSHQRQRLAQMHRQLPLLPLRRSRNKLLQNLHDLATPASKPRIP